jgi:hypothetical protein
VILIDLTENSFSASSIVSSELKISNDYNDDIYIGAYVVGSFTVDLTINEKRILAEAMTIPYLENKINHSAQLDQMVFGTNLGIHSQANHNKTLLSIKQDQYSKINRMISDYSYRSDPDDLENLVGST